MGDDRTKKLIAFSRTGRKASMIIAFLAGAAVFGAGLFTGATLVQSSLDRVLKSAGDE